MNIFNSRIFFLICFVAISVFISCKKEKLESETELIEKKSENSFEKDVEIKKMLTAFYSSYLKEFLNENIQESEKKLDSIKLQYCTKSLLDSISNEFENNELDYDPFIKAQDVSLDMIKSLSINKEAGSENKFKVNYFDKFSGDKVAILVTVIDENGSFKISSLK